MSIRICWNDMGWGQAWAEALIAMNNAYMESLFGALEREWVHEKRYRTRQEARYKGDETGGRFWLRSLEIIKRRDDEYVQPNSCNLNLIGFTKKSLKGEGYVECGVHCQEGDLKRRPCRRRSNRMSPTSFHNVMSTFLSFNSRNNPYLHRYRHRPWNIWSLCPQSLKVSESFWTSFLKSSH
jgi:hypothetical protein